MSWSENDTYAPGLMIGKTAFIAGGSSGINLGIARRLGELGARLFIISRSIDKVNNAVSQLQNEGCVAAGTSADVRSYEEVESAISECVDKHGGLDIVVSGAAGNFVSPASKLSPNGFRTVIDIDLVGSFHVCRAAYEHIRKPGGSIINISATQSFTPTPGQAHVCAAKAGIDALTKVLAIEWGEEGIRVNAIAPGPVDGTEGMSRLTPTEEHKKKFLDAIPLRRYANITEIADTVIFLCSPGGTNFNGSIVVCDGGQSTLGSGGFANAWNN